MEKKVTEREVNLLDMFWVICFKWRQVLGVALLFAVLAGGIGYWKSNLEAKKFVESAEAPNLDEIKLEHNSIRTVESYLEYVESYKNQIMYNEQSPLMHLDANGFYRCVISYYIDNHFKVEYPIVMEVNNIEALVGMYQTGLRDEKFGMALTEINGNKNEKAFYIKELVDCNNKYGNNSESNISDGILQVSIYSDNEQHCKEMAKITQETIASKKDEVSKRFGEHDIILIEESCDYVADIELLKYQQENVNKLVSYSNMIRDINSKLSEDEISYIKAYEKEYMGGTEELEENIMPSVGIDIKIIVIGFICGAAIVILIIAMKYVLNVRLRMEDDFESIYGVKLLGNIVIKGDGKKKLLSFIDNLFKDLSQMNKHYYTEDEVMNMVVASIKVIAKKLQISKVYATGAKIGKEEQKVIERLAAKLKKANIELIMGKSILYNAEAVEASAEVGHVLLVERAGETFYKEVEAEIDNCRHRGVEIIGGLVVKI